MWIDPLGSNPKWVRWWLIDVLDKQMLPFFKKQGIEITKVDRETQLKMFYDFFSNEMRLPNIYADNEFYRVKLDDATVTWYTLKYG